jgi:WD40 repeat protein
MHAGDDEAIGSGLATETGPGSASRLTGVDDPFGFAGVPPGGGGCGPVHPGTRIGSATLIRLIAEGGMGRVYEARQDAPDRMVAVKVLQANAPATDLVRRFAAEADLLGRMRHPAIAQIHAAGTHRADGAEWPFILMELVPGAATITAFARDHRLPVRDRVMLFARACSGVAHAHRAGVVHRDLKPGNMLVDSAGEPKVIDFGVARSLDPDAERLTTAAQQGELIGTIRYMSPEQLGIDSGEVDARSDVYALGLVLHELLLGELPYELRGRSVVEAACVLGSAGGVATGPLSRRLRRAGLEGAAATPLAAITATCLEPAPADRYASAVELEADLRRWLAGEPVAARPLSLSESLGRLARRHRAAAVAAAAVAASLVAAVVGITAFWLRAERQREAAEEARTLADTRLGEAEARTREARQQLYLSTVLLAAEARDRDNLREARRLLGEAESLASEHEATPIELPCLAASLDESLALLPDAGATIASARWAPDGRSVALGTMSGRLRTWQPLAAGAGSPTIGIAAHEAAIWDLAYAPDGRWLASASADGTVGLHDPITAERLGTLVGHEGAVYGVDVSPAGNLLATSSRDRTIRLWDPDTRAEVGTLRGHSGTVYAVRFTADGERLVSVSQDGTVRVWSVAKQTELRTIAAGDGRLFRLACGPNGLFAVAGEDGSATVWDADGGLIHRLRHPQRVNAVGFVGDGSELATASGDGLLRVWDLITGSETVRRRGHADALWTLAVLPGSTTVVTGSEDASARVWDTAAGPGPLLRFGGRVQALAMAPTGRLLAAADAAGRVRLVAADTLAERAAFSTPAGRVNSLAFAPDATRLLAACDDGSVHRWDLASGKPLAPFTPHTRRVYDVACSPDGLGIATGSEDRTARLVAADDGRELLPPLRHPARVFGVAFHPDGRRLATACGDRIVRLWNLADGRELVACRGHEGPVNWVAFSADGERLASASSDGTVRIWNVAAGATTSVLSGAARQVWRTAFSPDATRVAATVADGTVQVWDLASSRPVAVLRGHADQAWGLAFAADGRSLATSSWDGTVRLWGVSAASVTRPAAADDWNQFRGPTADGRAGSPALPRSWSETENVRWKTPIPGKAWASPVAADGRIWLANATEDGTRLSALCVDAETGRVLHDLTLFEIAEPAFCHPYNSPASPTPVISGGRVFVHFGSAGTACLDAASGEIIWKRQDLPCDHHRGPGSSPIPWRDRLFLNFDGVDQQYVVALDQTTGKTLWKTDRDIDYGSDDGDMKKAYGTPAVIEHDGRPMLVSPAAVATVAYDPATGAELWKVYHGGYNSAARPLAAGGLVIVTTSGGDNVVAIRPGGSGDVTKTHVAWKFKKSAPTRPSQAVVGDHLYLVSDTGVFSCVELATGRIAWQERRSGRHSASPVESGGLLWWCDEDGTTVVTKATPERFELLAENKLDAGCMASPAVVGDDLVIRTKTHLYRIGAGKP